MKAWLVRIAAVVVFGVSFALPAIRMSGSGPSQTMTGWMCAVIASITAPKALIQSLGQGVRFDEILIPISGLVNYLFLAVLVLSFWRRLLRTRLLFGTLLLPCFVATWMFFSSSKVTPLVGHYLWVAGAIVFLMPDVVILVHERRAAAAQPSAGGVQANR
ncbi:MAG: hypothetical protein WBX09_20565 [Terracidiphilus sp.]